MKKVEAELMLNISICVFLKQAYVFAIFSSHTICAHMKGEREKEREETKITFNSEKL